MPAKVFINTNSDNGMPFATEYYFRYSAHPVSHDKSLTRVKLVPVAKFSFLNLVASMHAHCQAGDDVILVCHGAPTTLGLYPKEGSGSWADCYWAGGFLRDFSSMADIMGLTFNQADLLQTQLYNLRKLKLNHLAVQACRIGRCPQFLRDLALIFNFRSVSAPTLRTQYGNCEVYMANDEQKKLFRADFPKFFDVPVSNGGVMTLATKKTGHSKADVVMLTDSMATVLRFLFDNFPEMPHLGNVANSKLTNYVGLLTGLAKPSLLPYHGLQCREAPHKLYFPKDRRYVSAMKYLSV